MKIDEAIEALKRMQAPVISKSKDQAEEIARHFIEGVGGLFDLYKYEMASALVEPKEVEGARWLIVCLINQKNRSYLDEIVKQANLHRQEFPQDKVICTARDNAE